MSSETSAPISSGRTVDRVDAICLMADDGQTGALVEGWYGDDITVQAQ